MAKLVHLPAHITAIDVAAATANSHAAMFRVVLFEVETLIATAAIGYARAGVAGMATWVGCAFALLALGGVIGAARK